MVDCDLAMDLPEGTTGRNPEDYLLKLREAQAILVQVTQDYLSKASKKMIRGWGTKKLLSDEVCTWRLCIANVS